MNLALQIYLAVYAALMLGYLPYCAWRFYKGHRVGNRRQVELIVGILIWPALLLFVFGALLTSSRKPPKERG